MQAKHGVPIRLSGEGEKVNCFVKILGKIKHLVIKPPLKIKMTTK